MSDEEMEQKYRLAFPALNGARKPKQAGVDVAPVMALIAGNQCDGPSTSTPAQAAAFAPFAALIFYVPFGSSQKGHLFFKKTATIFLLGLSNHPSLFIFIRPKNEHSFRGM
ncbi:hypothetical protein [Halalkalibaculum sp. DA384]|uniref:hypothetical protein n=1 Tax=Halalkalibaculum sp. DA384 TaxID=3373606 RepID=UPI00375531F7